MVVQALKWIGYIIAAAGWGWIVTLICNYLGLPPYEVGIAAGFAITVSLYTLKPSRMALRASQQAKSARRAQNR